MSSDLNPGEFPVPPKPIPKMLKPAQPKMLKPAQPKVGFEDISISVHMMEAHRVIVNDDFMGILMRNMHENFIFHGHTRVGGKALLLYTKTKITRKAKTILKKRFWNG